MNTSQFTGGAGVQVKVQLNAEAFDTNSNFNTSTYRYTAPVDGFYLLSWKIGMVSGANELMQMTLKKNGTTNIFAAYQQNGNAIQSQSLTQTELVQLTAGDYLELWMTTSFAGSASLDYGTPPFHTSMSGYLVSRT